jgi:hypothetical protein
MIASPLNPLARVGVKQSPFNPGIFIDSLLENAPLKFERIGQGSQIFVWINGWLPNRDIQFSDFTDGDDHADSPIRRSRFPGELHRHRTAYGHGSEAKSVQRDLEDVELGTSPAHQAMQTTFGKTVRVRELKGILNVARAWWQVKDGTYLPQPSRNQKRSFPLLAKYIDDHYDKIVPLLPHMVINNIS